MREKVLAYCPFCDREHKLYLLKKKTKFRDEDKILKYTEDSYLCKKSKKEFYDGELINRNRLRMLEEQKRARI